ESGGCSLWVLVHSPGWATPRWFCPRILESRCSIVVSIPACHAGDPGSIPGSGAIIILFTFLLPTHSHKSGNHGTTITSAIAF
ncbi:hypothetical protein BDL97_18G094700, partial [Sphagnum fallax]